MCLYNIDNSIKDKDFGYKIIGKDGRAKFFSSKKLPIGQWLNEYNYRQDYYKKGNLMFLDSEAYHDKLAYSMGWHVFYTKKEAISYNKYVLDNRDNRIVKVRIKYIVAKGYQCSRYTYRTIVCKYIKIEKENR